ncbi:hypothetical protein ACA910_015832 [Epithemia clementina (nom. ined.)]
MNDGDKVNLPRKAAVAEAPRHKRKDPPNSRASVESTGATDGSSTKRIKYEQGQRDSEERFSEQQEDLEAQKAEIPADVPELIQKMFGQVGFVKWNKNFRPVLVLSPLDVPMGPARSLWMKMYHKMKENHRPLESMSVLVYWYGEKKTSEYFNLVPQSKFIPYDDKATTKMLAYAKKAELKTGQGKNLTHDDKQRIRGMQQLREDLEKDPADRRRRFVL